MMIQILRNFTFTAAAVLFLHLGVHADAVESPIIFLPTQSANTNSDGGLRWAKGVQNIQIYRANRTEPAHQDGLGHTYLHAPHLAHWNGKFHLAYLSAPVNEHQTPTPTSYTSSVDGVHWDDPRILFPSYGLSDGSMTLTHQRMVFFIAPNGILLATAFHGEAPSPNDGSGIGRVVREIRRDGRFGPIYFIRYNQQAGWDQTKAKMYPFYTTSGKSEFVEACDSLLANKFMMAQWWEEDRSEDGFYRVKGKALSFYHQPDGKAVGIWKDAQVSISSDEGESWIRTGFADNLPVNSSKYWIQRTDDQQYAMVFNPTGRLRHPLAISLSEDGRHFDDLYAVHGELPVQRFPGLYKNMGPQYVRGIAEGNGNPDGTDLWVTYSVNKEDIWVSRIPVPVSAGENDPIRESFCSTSSGDMPAGWNIYRPLWAPIEVLDTCGEQGAVMQLLDEDPYDYASASRLFPMSRSVLITFKILLKQSDGRLEVDVAGPAGMRPVQIAFTGDGKIEARHEGIWKPAGSYVVDQWMDIEIDVNPGKNTERFQLRVNGHEVLYRIAYFTDFIPEVERLTFRTGTYRRRGDGGHELPGADIKSKKQAFLLDDVCIQPRP